MVINTVYLTYALEVERVGSITQAAQNLFMAQSNLSKVLKDLERDLGFPIFVRSANGVKATDEGTEFLYHAKQIIEQLQAMENIKQHSVEGKLCYKISVPRGSYITGGFTAFMSDLNTDKELEITFNETNALETIANVAERGYNVGVIRYQLADENYFMTSLKNHSLNYETLWEFEYVLVMSKHHPLAAKKDLCMEDLKPYTEITHGDIKIPHEKQKDKKEKSTAENVIYVYERGSQFDLLTNVPTTYMWVSPIPQALLDKNELVQRVCKFENNLCKDLLIYRKEYRLNEYDRLFQKKLYESKVDVSVT